MKNHPVLFFLFMVFCFLTPLSSQAQTPVDAWVITTVPVNDVVEGTMFITLADTNQVDLIEIKLGSKDGVFDLFSYSFAYDQTTLNLHHVW